MFQAKNDRDVLEVDMSAYSVPKIIDALNSDKNIIIFYGWRSGGKSTSIFNIALMKCLLSPHFRAVHCRAKYNEVQGSTFKTICDQIKELGLDDYFYTTNDNFKIINKSNTNNYFQGGATDLPDKIRSVPNLNWIILEEAHELTQDGFASLIGTLRARKGQDDIKLLLVFNNDKVSTRSFIHNTFFDPQSPMYKEAERVLIKYTDNQFIDQENATKINMMAALNNEQRFNELLNGKFITEKPNDPWLYGYYQKSNKWDTQRMGEMPVYETPIGLSFDWNVNKFCGIAYQNVIDNDFKKRFHVLKSFVVYSDDPMLKIDGNSIFVLMAKKILQSFPNHFFTMTGDRTGANKNIGFTMVGNNCIKEMARHLMIGFGAMKFNSYNPKYPAVNESHQNSYILCNSIWLMHPNFYINDIDCDLLWDDIERAEVNPDGKKPQELKKTAELDMNMFDALRHAIDAEFGTGGTNYSRTGLM